MSKLIVLSNRVNLPTDHHPAGGLAVALQDALAENGGIWLGWNGEKIESKHEQNFSYLKVNNVEYMTCPLTQREYDQYYCGFSNNTLWPAMHEREDLIEFKAEEFKTYQEVNRLFALELKKISNPDDMIWVHDYHFLSVAAYCRELGMKNRFGFFLHIPFADQTIWEKLPVATSLIKHLCQYDVIGLQTEDDQKKCLHMCQNLLKTPSSQSNSIEYENREVKIQCYPIGINPELIQKAANTKIDSKSKNIFEFENLIAQKTIISVDRIDYSKGMLERFNALSEFLKLHPEYQKMITDLQIACPCRMDIPAYSHLFDQVQEKVIEINEEFSHDDWSPINCTNETVEHSQLMSIYRQSDICWVNSLKDGMNLVAKEFIAAQNENNPGVLILSKYTGAADQMPEAIIVDPKCSKSMMKALKKALVMSKTERLERYKYLMKGLKKFDINDWRNAFLKDLKLIKTNVILRPRFKSHYKSVSASY